MVRPSPTAQARRRLGLKYHGAPMLSTWAAMMSSHHHVQQQLMTQQRLLATAGFAGEASHSSTGCKSMLRLV